MATRSERRAAVADEYTRANPEPEQDLFGDETPMHAAWRAGLLRAIEAAGLGWSDEDDAETPATDMGGWSTF